MTFEGVELPEGWTHEPYAHSTVVVAPGLGGVSIDFERRAFALGWTVVRPNYLTPQQRYGGRGWRTKLVQDAVNALQASARRTPERKPQEGKP